MPIFRDPLEALRLAVDSGKKSLIWGVGVRKMVKFDITQLNKAPGMSKRPKLLLTICVKIICFLSISVFNAACK